MWIAISNATGAMAISPEQDNATCKYVFNNRTWLRIQTWEDREKPPMEEHATVDG